MTRTTRAACLGLAGLTIAGTGCVMPDQLSQLQKDVASLSQQLRRVERDQSDLQTRVDELGSRPEESPDAVSFADLADVELQVEQLSRQVAVTQERINEIDQRMDGLSQELQQARISSRTPASISGPGDYGTGDPLNPPPLPSRPSAAAVPDPEALYNTAYADFSKGNYALAISGFQEYQQSFPDSALADNALYWIAECHFSQGDYTGAVDALDRLLAVYPRSDKAAAGNLKKALAFLEQNQLKQGIVQLQYVVQAYPGTDEARLARDKLSSLGAPQR